MQLGRYPAASHVIAHLSDTHLLAGAALLGGAIDTAAALAEAIGPLRRLGDRLDAIVVTGDIADLGEPEAYAVARNALEPVARVAGAALVWVMGNHDERAPFRAELLGEVARDAEAADAPVRSVTTVAGLRIVALDTTVPGYHHGALDAEALGWLEQVLAEPAPSGTVLAMHHAPIPTPLALMDVLELQGQSELAELCRGSDVRLVLGGHLHYATSGRFAGIPVSVAGATSYTMDLSAPARELVGLDGGRSFSIVRLFDDAGATDDAEAAGSGEATVSIVPVSGQGRTIPLFDAAFLSEIERLDPAARLERFSRKPAS